jgi:hypothetical protein
MLHANSSFDADVNDLNLDVKTNGPSNALTVKKFKEHIASIGMPPKQQKLFLSFLDYYFPNKNAEFTLQEFEMKLNSNIEFRDKLIKPKKTWDALKEFMSTFN